MSNFAVSVDDIKLLGRFIEVVFTDGENHFARVSLPLSAFPRYTAAELGHYFFDRAQGLLADERIKSASRHDQVRHWRLERGWCLGQLFDAGFTAAEIVEALGVMPLAHDLWLIA